MLDPLGSARLIGDQHHVQALSHLGLPRSPCRRSAQSCEGRGPSGAPGPSPSRYRADPGSRESGCCLTIETSGQLWPVSPNGSASPWMVCSAASSRLRRHVEPATAIAGTLTQLSGIGSPTTRKSRPRSVRNHQHAAAGKFRVQREPACEHLPPPKGHRQLVRPRSAGFT